MTRTWLISVLLLAACGGGGGGPSADPDGGVGNDNVYGSCFESLDECDWCVEYTGNIFEMDSVLSSYRDECTRQGLTWSPEACPRAGATLRCTLHEGLETEASNVYYSCPMEGEQCDALSGVRHQP